LHSSFLDGPELHPAAKAAATGAAAYAPLLFLRPVKRRHGVGGFVTDPRVLPAVPIAILAVAKGIVDARRADPGEQKKDAAAQAAPAAAQAAPAAAQAAPAAAQAAPAAAQTPRKPRKEAAVT